MTFREELQYISELQYDISEFAKDVINCVKPFVKKQLDLRLYLLTELVELIEINSSTPAYVKILTAVELTNIQIAINAIINKNYAYKFE